MFRFTQEPLSESRSQCLAKITGMVQVPPCTVKHTRTHTHTHTKQVGICRHNSGKERIDKHSGIIPLI